MKRSQYQNGSLRNNKVIHKYHIIKYFTVETLKIAKCVACIPYNMLKVISSTFDKDNKVRRFFNGDKNFATVREGFCKIYHTENDMDIPEEAYQAALHTKIPGASVIVEPLKAGFSVVPPPNIASEELPSLKNIENRKDTDLDYLERKERELNRAIRDYKLKADALEYANDQKELLQLQKVEEERKRKEEEIEKVKKYNENGEEYELDDKYDKYNKDPYYNKERKLLSKSTTDSSEELKDSPKLPVDPNCED